jgi:AcrR family transcriptional regulator
MSTRDTMGCHERRKERTRQALIDASIALFMDRGIYRTRVEDIRERAVSAKVRSTIISIRKMQLLRKFCRME